MILEPVRYQRFVLLGGGRPLLAFAEGAIAQGRAVQVISSPAQLAAEFAHGTLESELTDRNIPFESRVDLPPQRLVKHVDNETLGLSVSSPWIFRREHIDVFRGALLNLHGAALPRHRGAGGDTWQILQGRQKGGFTLHAVNEGIDTGAIILQELFDYPSACRTPSDRQRFAMSREAVFVHRVIDALCGREPLPARKQNHDESTYWPRLDTRVNGFVDWSWSAGEIRTFVDAFDSPYAGAGTYLGDRLIRLSGCEKAAEGPFHAFQAGLVYRANDGRIHVAARGSGLSVARVVDGETGEPFRGLRVGDRLHTPRAVLEQALTYRPRYTANGMPPPPALD